MSAALVECIPNFSEGRRPEVVEKIVDAVRSVEGAILLDYSSDADHNRSVVTFVGSPQAVEEAAFAAIAKAAELIDLNEHEGAHPRIGATDVVPFVPISGITMEACVEMARRVGKRVGEELNVPVFLYEKAASRPDRVNLAKVRKGDYEGLKEDIKANPDRQPDFGPAELGPAGATVIGARAPLVAYNVYLDTDDVEIATKVAKSVRYLNGGLRYVKGLGMLVDGKAQVSMNLTDYKRTPVFRVVEMIRREAARYGASITHSELIGLIPQEALIDAAAWYLQLDGFETDQVLEARIQAEGEQAAGKVEPGQSFLDELAAGKATPGGGSAAAYGAAMGAGLVAMVARLTVNKKAYKEVEERMWAVIERAEALRADLTKAVDEDALAFTGVMAAFRLPKATDEEKSARQAAIQAATMQAAKVPLAVAGMAVSVMELAVEAAEKGNLNAITDAASGFALANAALTGAAMNVRINIISLEDSGQVKSLTKQLEEIEKQAKQLESKVQAAVSARGKIAYS